MRERNRAVARAHSWTPFAVVLAATAASTLVAAALHARVSGSDFLFVYIPPITVASYLSGRPAGLAAALLSVLSARYFILPPPLSFSMPGHTASVLGLFALAALAGALAFGPRDARRAAGRAADRTARLQAITAALSRAVTPDQVAEAVVEHGIRALGAQAGSMALLAEDGETLEVVRSVGYPEPLEEKWRRFSRVAPAAVADAVRTGQVVSAESGDDLAARSPLFEAVPGSLRGGAHAAVPLLLHGRAVGALCVNFPERRRFDQEDLNFMMALGHQCAQAVERARLYAREHRVAETLQRAFLPASLTQVPGSEVHATYVPGTSESEVGGDWYDVFRLADGRLALSVGDVVGRGLRAAVVMGQLRQSIRAAALEGHGPAGVLDRAGAVLRLTYEHEGMATAVFGVFDPIASAFAYAAAGHPAPILARPDGRVEVLASGGLPLGFEFRTPPSWTVDLPPGSLLVLYTDGLTEARRNPQAGEARLLAAVRSELAARSADPSRAIVERVLAGARAPDDIAVVTLARSPAPVDRLDLTVPAEPASLRLVRHALQQLGTSVGLEQDRIDALTIALGEAVNNVIEHAYGVTGGTVHLRARRDGDVLVVEVEDHGRWRMERADERGGRGLHIMRALVDAVEVDAGRAGTTVRLELSLARRPGPPQAAPTPREDSRATGPGPVAPAPERGAAAARAIGEPGVGSVRVVAEVPVVDVVGEIDLTHARRFQAVLERAASMARSALIVSLAGASYFDSQALQVLLLFGRRLVANRRSLLLVAPRAAALRRLLDVVDAAAAFPLFESVEDAVAAARSKPASLPPP